MSDKNEPKRSEDGREEPNLDDKVRMINSIHGVYARGDSLYMQVIGGPDQYVGPASDAWKYRILD